MGLAATSAAGWPPWAVVHGEDISGAQPAGLYLNLINQLNVIGVALNTLPVSFIFEFGTSLLDEHPLDFLGVRHVHSVADVHYLSPDAARSRTGPEPSPMSDSCPCGQGSPRSVDRSQHVADV